MATLITERRFSTKPSYNIQWCEGKIRRTLHLGGRYDKKTAQRLKDVIERLLYYRWNPDVIPDKMTMHWLQHAPAEIRAKLAKAGLIAVTEVKTCQNLWDTFLKHKTDLKPSSEKNYLICRELFFETFLPTETVEKITSDRLLQWKATLLKKYAPATVTLLMTLARAVFNWAVRQEWLTKSPMVGIKSGSFENRDKDRTITMEEYHKLLDACKRVQRKKVLLSL